MERPDSQQDHAEDDPGRADPAQGHRCLAPNPQHLPDRTAQRSAGDAKWVGHRDGGMLDAVQTMFPGVRFEVEAGICDSWAEK